MAQKMVPGFQENPDFPAPPFSSSDLNNMLTALIAQIATQAANQATTQQSTALKKTMTKDTARVMKAMIRYAVDAVQGDDAKLTAIGWGGIAEPTPHVLVPPGQPRDLRVTQQYEDSLDIAWIVPADGGLVGFYRVEQREQAEGGKWKIASSGMHTNDTLSDLERGKVWEYRVIAVNKAGHSLPSNTVTAVL